MESHIFQNKHLSIFIYLFIYFVVQMWVKDPGLIQPSPQISWSKLDPDDNFSFINKLRKNLLISAVKTPINN